MENQMKKNVVLIAALLALLAPAASFAAGSCTQTLLGRATLHGSGAEMVVVKVACTADAADGSIPATTVSGVGGNLQAVFVDMGATAPTSAAYDVLVKATSMADADLLGGAGANLTTTADQWVTPLVGNVYAPAPFYGDLSVAHTGNAVNSATPTVYMFFTGK
jgi:hypothetical protein